MAIEMIGGDAREEKQLERLRARRCCFAVTQSAQWSMSDAVVGVTGVLFMFHARVRYTASVTPKQPPTPAARAPSATPRSTHGCRQRHAYAVFAARPCCLRYYASEKMRRRRHADVHDARTPICRQFFAAIGNGADVLRRWRRYSHDESARRLLKRNVRAICRRAVIRYDMHAYK